MSDPSAPFRSDAEVLNAVSLTFERELADFDELSYADIAVLLYSRALISESDALTVLAAGRIEASNDLQVALVKQQQGEALLNTLRSPGAIRFFSNAMKIPSENIRQLYIEAVSNKRRILAAFMHLPSVNSTAELKEKSVNLTLAEKEVTQPEVAASQPRYMSRTYIRDSRQSNVSGRMSLEKDLRFALATMSHEQKANFEFHRALLEGEKSSLDAMIRRKETFINELKQIANSSKSDVDFDRRMTTRIKKGW